MNKETQGSEGDELGMEEGPALYKSKAFVIGSAALIIVLLVAASITVAQFEKLQLSPNNVVQVVCDGRGLRLERISRTIVELKCQSRQTADPAPEPTDKPTPGSPHDPIPEPDLDPHPMPGGGRTEPYAGAPHCTDIGLTHNRTRYHALWDAQNGCHWSHTHNGDPYRVNHIFGEPGAWFGNAGQSISYPWQTWKGLDSGAVFPGEGSGQLENDLKHAGYKWDVHDFDGSCEIENDLDPRVTRCIKAHRVLYHWVGGASANLTRFHSFSAELLSCPRESKSIADCGIVRTGGTWDTGFLMVPYKPEVCDVYPEPGWYPLPQDPPGEFNCHQPPYRGPRVLADMQAVAANGGNVLSTWNSRRSHGFMNIVDFDVITRDDWQGADVNDPGRIQLICPDFQCHYNHSTALVYEIILNKEINDLIGQFGESFQVYVDRGQNPAGACTEPGPFCVPLVVENLPAQVSGRFHSFQRLQQTRRSQIRDYEMSPPGVWWIEFPN